MEGIHDLGGIHGFGPVVALADEPPFHADWEPRVRAMSRTVMSSGRTNAAMFRHAIERMEPAHYLRAPYYERWLTALATLLVEQGVLPRAELEARAPGFPLSGPLASTVALEVALVEATAGGPQPAYRAGETVRVREDVRFGGHSRCPRYVVGRRGEIVRVDPPAPVPEIEAHRGDRVLERTYGVRFALADLWGSGDGAVHVDLYEHYLEPSGAT